MESIPEPKIRDVKRKEIRWERQLNRKAELDVNRPGLGEMLQELHDVQNLSTQDIKGLASRIKRRKHAEVRDLVKLSYGFQQSADNISEFVRTTGAINVIVKELTGHDSDRQLLAAECLCNLALGDEVVCEKIATFAGTYLIALVENLNHLKLNSTCIWTLQNMIASGSKPMKILHSQGVVASLISLLQNLESGPLLAEVLLALELALDYELTFISQETILASILPLAIAKEPQINSLRVTYKSLCVTKFETLDPETPHQVVRHCVKQLINLDINHGGAEIVLVVRIMANLIATKAGCGELLLTECFQHSVRLSELFNVLAGTGQTELCREILWLLGNLNRCADVQNMQEYLKFDDFVQRVNIPVELLV